MNEFRAIVISLLVTVAWLFFWLSLLFIVASHLMGCTFVDGDRSFSIMQLAPGDDVQSRTTTLVGLEAAPMGIDGPQFRLGYIRSQQARVPSYDKDSDTPKVQINTSVDKSGVVTETFSVGENPPAKKSWF